MSERPGLLGSELRAMTAGGVERVRVAAYWRYMQPYRDGASVPPGERSRFRSVDGVPNDFASLDRVVAAAAERRLPVLPVVLACPSWAALDPTSPWSPPRRAAEYARFVAALARRYGPGGGFWRERPRLPRLPVRSWQVWNEPNTRLFWTARSWTRGYVSLLRPTRRALRRVDRRATLVLGGLVNRSWSALDMIYRGGGRRLFDVVAIHPFSRRPGHVVAILRLVRGVMERRGDRRKPLWVTELSCRRPREGLRWTTGSTSRAGSRRGCCDRRSRCSPGSAEAPAGRRAVVHVAVPGAGRLPVRLRRPARPRRPRPGGRQAGGPRLPRVRPPARGLPQARTRRPLRVATPSRAQPAPWKPVPCARARGVSGANAARRSRRTPGSRG